MDEKELKKQEELRKKFFEDHKELSKVFDRVFNSHDGQAILKHLEIIHGQSCLMTNPMMDVQATIQPSDFMFMREGQNQVIRYIKAMMMLYKREV